MSILIKDMEMPETCAECPLGEYEDAIYFHCALMEFSYIHKAESDRLDNCPLSEAQEPCEDAVKTITEASFTGRDGLDYVETLVALNALKIRKMTEDIEAPPSAQPEQAVKDCRNCKHGKYNDYHDTYFCYNPENCSNWDKWETSAQLQIIRCKDCKFYREYGCQRAFVYPEPDDFCSRAERRKK